jgi:uncharacterized protein (DUF697 family)/GTP-binding protein EngB required for normal cell division
MTVRLQRPIVVGGLALVAGLWGLDSLHHSLDGIGDWLTLGAIATGGGYWWWYRQRSHRPIADTVKVDVNRETLNQAIGQAELVIDRLAVENPTSAKVEQFRQQLAQVKANLDRPDRRIAVTGGQRVGKTTLINLLATDPVPANVPLKYLETPSLFTVGENSADNEATARQMNLAADLVLFLTNGDLTATEYKYLQELHHANQRVILLFNQHDRYLPDERTLILTKLQSTVNGILTKQDVVSTSTAPAPMKVRQLQADGTAIEQIEIPPVEIAPLTQQLGSVLAKESDKLLWATTYRELAGVKTDAKIALNAARRDRAMPIIEQNQWIVAAAAFANPLPALDLLATAAVNTQMIVDLGALYQQKFTLEQAETAAGAMGNVMLKLGLVELCTQTVANLLKTNAITFVAGGLVQGLSAAYLTRIAGLTLVEYLEAQDLLAPEPARAWNLELLGNTFQKVFQANERMAYLQTIVKQGVARLLPDTVPAKAG